MASRANRGSVRLNQPYDCANAPVELRSTATEAFHHLLLAVKMLWPSSGCGPMSLKTALAVLLVSQIALAPAFSQVKSDGKTNEKQEAKISDKPASFQDFSREAYVIEKFDTRITVEDDGNNVRERTAEVKMLADA